MKERLTGAIILVALIVLLVPELLTGPIRAKSARTAVLTVALPPAARAGRTGHAEPPLHTYTLTLDGRPTPATVATPTAPAQAAATSQQSSPEISAQGPTASTAEAAQMPQTSAAAESGGLQLPKTPPHSPAREARSSGSSGGWVVQLGSFASHRNADRLARSLESRGFRMSVSPARAGARVLWRVRAGPAHDRAGAQHLAARLRALGHRGELLPVK